MARTTPAEATQGSSRQSKKIMTRKQTVQNTMVKVEDFPADVLRQCRSCSEKHMLSDLYEHYETEHQLCYCMYCESTHKTRVELSTHLETEHKISPQCFQDFE